YRLSDDVERWRLKDPIERVRAYLQRNGLGDPDFFDAVAGEADDLGARLRAVPRLVRGEPLMPKITLAKGLNMGLRKAMEDDPKVLIMGEDVGKLGGVFRITDGLQKDFGEDRVIDSPLAESGIVGTAVGLALRGYRPVVEIQFDGFVYPAYDQIVCQVA